MKVLNLQCAGGHKFEGWFASNAAFDAQRERGLVTCPICSDGNITKLLSAPRLNLGLAAAQGGAHVPADMAQEARWLRAVRQVMAATEDVGARFADEARRIHYGEAPERTIRGQATADQTEALRDEGIAVVSVALPAALKETLQ